jgi:hypothetical protein
MQGPAPGLPRRVLPTPHLAFGLRVFAHNDGTCPTPEAGSQQQGGTMASVVTTGPGGKIVFMGPPPVFSDQWWQIVVRRRGRSQRNASALRCLAPPSDPAKGNK